MEVMLAVQSGTLLRALRVLLKRRVSAQAGCHLICIPGVSQAGLNKHFEVAVYSQLRVFRNTRVKKLNVVVKFCILIVRNRIPSFIVRASEISS